MTEGFTLRKAGKEDYAGIHALFLALHRQHVAGRPDIYREADPLPQEEYERILADGNALLLAAFAEEKLAGFCQLSFRLPENPILQPQKTAFIEAIAVSEPFRRQGLGKLLFSHVREYAREKGAARLSLHVWCFNEAAIAFYRRLGLQDQLIAMEELL